MVKIVEMLNSISNDLEYQSLNESEKNLFSTYAMLGELLNPNDAYTYKEKLKGFWIYNDIMNNLFFVRFVYTPVAIPYYELKTGWIDTKQNNKIRYELPDNATAKDWDKRSNTVAKIYKDEILPMFINQNICDTFKIIPNDIKRYQFSIRLVNKFKNNNILIIENKPKEILIKKYEK